jgi:hypothetical protein
MALQPYQRTRNGLPTGGFTLSTTGATDGDTVAGGGRPEPESGTPVNMEN